MCEYTSGAKKYDFSDISNKNELEAQKTIVKLEIFAKLDGTKKPNLKLEGTVTLRIKMSETK